MIETQNNAIHNSQTLDKQQQKGFLIKFSKGKAVSHMPSMRLMPTSAMHSRDIKPAAEDWQQNGSSIITRED